MYYDLLILGGGIAGMTAALYAKRANLNFKIVDSNPFGSGLMDNAIKIENYPGFDSISGFELGQKVKTQLENLGVEIQEQTIKTIFQDQSSKLFIIDYSDGQISDIAKTVIYALGRVPRKLPFETEIPTHYCAICDGALYKDKNVMVVGGGNSAITEAVYLSNIAKNVYISVVENGLVADSVLLEKIKETPNIRLIKSSTIVKTNEKFVYLTTANQGEMVQVDGIFCSIGQVPIVEPLQLPLYFTEDKHIVGSECGVTNIKGFFVAGDVRAKANRQILTAAADGANCVLSVINYLRG